MRDQTKWSVSLGTWAGVRVRLHMLFFLFIAFTLYFSWAASQAGDGADEAPVAAVALALLLASVVIHELGHAFAAAQAGFPVEQVVLAPYGGAAPLPQMPRPQSEWKVYLAGPLANFIVCGSCAAALLALGERGILGLLHPLRPSGLGLGELTKADALKLAFWINWVVGLINLIPCFPFDGGRALRAMIFSCWPQLGRQTAGMLVSRAAQFVAVGLLLVAWFTRHGEAIHLIPPWFVLTLLAIFLFFSAKQEDHRSAETSAEEQPFGYDFSEGYTSLERPMKTQSDQRPPPAPGFFTRLVHRWRAERERQRRALEAAEEKRVDEVLARLHQHGMENLSPEDRALLQRVSARYRNRGET